ncbi:hypothetical protein FPQ18DRAFT_353952 [Pyronema domesticum]|nr:hypothetical protein FPQ18DRAFT_353952 [Pyronema domesticum]
MHSLSFDQTLVKGRGSLFCCSVQKPLIEDPQSSSVRSPAPLYDPMRQPRFSTGSLPPCCHLHFSPRGTTTCLLRTDSNSVRWPPTQLHLLLRLRSRSDSTALLSSSCAPALCSLHFSLRGTPPASPPHRVLLCWTLCRKDQYTQLRPPRRPRLRSDATAPLSLQQRTGALLPTVLPSGNNHLLCHRARTGAQHPQFLSLGLRAEGPLTAIYYNWSRPSDTPRT